MMLGLSLPAYADIERGKKDVTMKRLEQIAEKLGVSLSDIISFGDKVSNFFDQCNGSNINAGNAQHKAIITTIPEKYNYKLEKALLEIEKLNIKVEKTELEVKYWREKCENL